MIRLIANVDMPANSLTTRSAANVTMIVVAPTASGSSAATRLRNTSSENRNRIGAASISALRRSSSTWSPTCSKATVPPPSVTPGSRASRASIRCATSSSSAPAANVATT